MNTQKLIPHLFRTEYSKIVAVLTKKFGMAELETAEDIASDTFLTAMQSWGIEGTPENPTAWLYVVAANKAKNYFKRQNHFDEKISPTLDRMHEAHALEINLSDENIRDSQLQMMFAVCHPTIPAEAQIGLALRLLCGFSIDEIANAFLTSKETINKRLYRAREKLRDDKTMFDNWTQRVDPGLPIVLKTIYLLFNEGYYSLTSPQLLRKDLCIEAIRLCTLLIESKSTNKPEVNALMALMCFHFSRFEARVSRDGELILYDQQDTSQWNQNYISKGVIFLERSTNGTKLSVYHLEAGIAYWYTQKSDDAERWKKMLQLYDKLVAAEYSQIAALNRIFVLSKVAGKAEAIRQCNELTLTNNHSYNILMGELYTGIDDDKAVVHFQRAMAMATSHNEQKVISDKLKKLR